MALNRQSILAEYEAIQKQVAGKQRELIGAETPETYRARLERELSGREIAPSVAREEREVLKRMFAAPAAIRERLGPEVSPYEAERLVGQRQANWIDQLSGLRDLRESREDDLKDVISSAALGYRAEVETRQATMQALKDEATAKWREYQQAYREYTDSITNQILGTLAERDRAREREMFKDFDTKFNDTREKSDDDFISIDDYFEARNEYISEFGIKNAEFFHARYPINNWLNLDDSVVMDEIVARKDFRMEDLSESEARAFDPYHGMSLSETKDQVATDVINYLEMGESPESCWTYAVSYGVIPDPLASTTSPEYKIYKAFLRSEAGKQFLNERR